MRRWSPAGGEQPDKAVRSLSDSAGRVYWAGSRAGIFGLG